jgi:hypothetical protein
VTGLEFPTVAMTPPTITAMVATVPTVVAVAPAAPVPPAPVDAPPACAIALPASIARKITAANLVMSPPKETEKGEFNAASTLAHTLKSLQYEPNSGPARLHQKQNPAKLSPQQGLEILGLKPA